MISLLRSLLIADPDAVAATKRAPWCRWCHGPAGQVPSPCGEHDGTADAEAAFEARLRAVRI